MQYCRRKATGGQGEFNFQDIRCRIMPRQADQGETQNTALLLQPGIFQPLAQLRLGRRQLLLRSEERRVGKECRTRWWRKTKIESIYRHSEGWIGRIRSASCRHMKKRTR